MLTLIPLIAALIATAAGMPADTGATSSASSPPPLLKRAQDVLDPPNQKTVCNREVYDKDRMVAAAKAALKHKPKPIGANKYPHPYQNTDGVTGWNPKCDTTQLYLFPIGGKGEYDGGKAPANRIVVDWVDDDVRICGALTHIGSGAKNGFIGCEPTYASSPDELPYEPGWCQVTIKQTKPKDDIKNEVEVKDTKKRTIASVTTETKGKIEVQGKLRHKLEITEQDKDVVKFEYHGQVWNTDTRGRCTGKGWNKGKDKRDIKCGFSC